MASKRVSVRLPIEIWHECFTYLNLQDHRNLSLTCHLFNDICLRFLFGSISYSSRIWLGKNEPPEAMDKQLAGLKTMIRQLKAFAKSPRHVAVIRECVLSYSIRLATRANKAASDKGRKAYTPFVDAFVECLPLFANLKKVDVAEFMLKMDKKILSALASHPSLEEVSLSTVRFGVHLLKPRIKLKRLSISNSDWKDCNPNSSSKYLDMFSGEKLESLSASTTVYAPKIFRALARQGTAARLRDLSFRINPDNLSDLYNFLGTCPNVESIRVGFGSVRNSPSQFTPKPLPRSVLPLLKSFCGPTKAVDIFIPGRPVKEIKIIDDDCSMLERHQMDAHHLFASISQSTGSIMKLDIEKFECSSELLSLIQGHFPHLEHLEVSMPIEEVFAGEDPWDTKLDNMEQLKEKIAAGALDLDSCISYTAHFRTNYMTFLHWIAHKKLQLPSGIKELFLVDISLSGFLLHSSDSDTSDSSSSDGSNGSGDSDNLNSSNDLEALFLSDNNESFFRHLELKFKKNFYSYVTAQAIMQSISASYPNLQYVAFGRRMNGNTPARWIKQHDGKWTYGRGRHNMQWSSHI